MSFFKASVTLDTNHIIGEVHPHLYGANLEHIGRSVYDGHWAEMLKNRKFAGHDRMYIGLSEGLSHQYPSYGVLLPWEAVNPDYHNVLCVHDNTTFYVGTQSQRITIRRADGLPHGIKQSGLWLKAGQAYDLRLVLKGEGQSVQVTLGDATWTLEAVSNEWTTYQAQLNPKQDNPDGLLSITFQGEGNLWIGAASLMPADTLEGHRPDVVAALREWTPTFLRWPGGNFASAYHWEAGLGDPDKRNPYLDPAWQHWESNDVGTDEFMALCRLVGSEPILTINMGNGTAAEAAAWVEYCNGSHNTPYGQLRAQNGHPEPYKVKTWFVGNEQFGNWQVGHVDAETYAQLYLEYAAAMRAIDPNLNLIAVGVPTDLYGHWNELVLKAVGDKMDELSVHYYSIRTELSDEPPPPEQRYWPKVASAHEVVLMLDQTLEVIAAYSDPPVPLAFDEWNTYIEGKAPDFFENYNIADALYTGALMNHCLRRCDRIKLSAIFNLINVMGNYRVTPSQVWKTPSTLVLELMTRYRGAVALGCTVESPTTPTPAAGNLPAFEAMPYVDAAATWDAAQRRLYLSLVNRHPETEAEINLSGIQTQSNAQMFIIQGDDPLALNTEDEPQAVQIETATWALDSPLRLPAHSFSMLILEVG